ncbi:non-specific serine/threonine protein kinase [Ranunculus cassubicifolius]
MESLYEKNFPLSAKDYEMYEEVGEGVSATVYRALCIPLNATVAVKVLDLEKCNNDSVLAGIQREVQTMSSIDHPNVLRSYCSFTDEHKLWVVMPYMAGGSCLHIMKSTHPGGFDEPIIATLLYEVLKALAYLHGHGYIHRDVKAGNILIDSNGTVKVGDFGVSASLFDNGDRQRSRNTFVGTPCWMAPEVMQQLHGYDFKADMWSFGITALELARGHAPFSKYSPIKVLLMTLQNAPPSLDHMKDKRFSKYFRSLVIACLVKDPKKRPSSAKLLKHPFFQKTRSNEYISKTLLHGLSPLGDRFRTLKAKEAELLVQNNAICGDKEKLSQQEYIRGISGWDFKIEDLKSEASIDYDAISNAEDPEQRDGQEENSFVERINSTLPPRHEDKFGDHQNTTSSSASDPISTDEEQKGCDLCTDDTTSTKIPRRKDMVRSGSEPPLPLQFSPRGLDETSRKSEDDYLLKSPLPNTIGYGEMYSPLPPEYLVSPSRKANNNDDREFRQPKFQIERNCSVGDISEGTIIRRKGRFKVTSGELSPKGTSITSINSGENSSNIPIPPTTLVASILPSLQSILQQNTTQKETLVKLIKSVEGNFEFPDLGCSDPQQVSTGSARERELQALVNQLQHSNDDLFKELQRLKTENAQLESQIGDLCNKENQGQ